MALLIGRRMFVLMVCIEECVTVFDRRGIDRG